MWSETVHMHRGSHDTLVPEILSYILRQLQDAHCLV